MEAIYFLQKDGENERDVFKIGRTKHINVRMNAPEYRNKTKCYIIYVLNDELAETELIETYNLYFQRARDKYPMRKYGKEEYYIPKEEYNKAFEIFKTIGLKYSQCVLIHDYINNKNYYEIPNLQTNIETSQLSVDIEKSNEVSENNTEKTNLDKNSDQNTSSETNFDKNEDLKTTDIEENNSSQSVVLNETTEKLSEFEKFNKNIYLTDPFQFIELRKNLIDCLKEILSFYETNDKILYNALEKMSTNLKEYIIPVLINDEERFLFNSLSCKSLIIPQRKISDEKFNLIFNHHFKNKLYSNLKCCDINKVWRSYKRDVIIFDREELQIFISTSSLMIKNKIDKEMLEKIIKYDSLFIKESLKNKLIYMLTNISEMDKNEFKLIISTLKPTIIIGQHFNFAKNLIVTFGFWKEYISDLDIKINFNLSNITNDEILELINEKNIVDYIAGFDKKIDKILEEIIKNKNKLYELFIKNIVCYLRDKYITPHNIAFELNNYFASNNLNNISNHLKKQILNIVKEEQIFKENLRMSRSFKKIYDM